MLNKPMTTEQYFNKVCGILKEKDMMPDILYYELATYKSVSMKTYEFNIRNNLDYGGNESIYLDLWIEYYEDKEKSFHQIRHWNIWNWKIWYVR